MQLRTTTKRDVRCGPTFGFGEPPVTVSIMTMAALAEDAEETACRDHLSISQLISSHPRERLYVHPLCWTARHLALLGCHFVNLGLIVSMPKESDAVVPSAPTTAPAKPSSPSEEKKPSAYRAAYLFVHAANYPSQRVGLARLLLRALGLENFSWVSRAAWSSYSCDFPSLAFAVANCKAMQFFRSSDMVPFYFARSPVAKLPCFTFSRPPKDGSPTGPLQLPHLAFINLRELRQYRTSILCVSHRKRPRWPFAHALPPPGSPAWHRVEKQRRALQPAISREDPYIAALLVAQAQAQRLEYGETGRSALQTVLLTHPKDQNLLHIYTSEISKEVLDRFDFPSCPPPACAPSRLGITIVRRRITLKPLGTLQNRLAAALFTRCGYQPSPDSAIAPPAADVRAADEEPTLATTDSGRDTPEDVGAAAVS
ncbi:hypothetical protein RB597_005756 [Gaeumannomyces tritici]